MTFKKISKKIIVFLVVVSFIAPSIALMRPQKAEAFFHPQLVYDPINTAANITARIVQELRETVLDGIAYSLSKMVIGQLTTQMVNWINSGFEGNPLYVTNLDFYLSFVCANTLNEFMSDITSSTLDPTTERLISRSLLLSNPCASQQLIGGSSIGQSITQTFSNDFVGGGAWNTWTTVTTNPRNNPYGQLLLTSDQLSIRIAQNRERELQQLAWGQGFLGLQKCETTQVGINQDPKKICHTVTPGSLIEDELAFTLGSGIRQLELADEINEIVGSLFSTLFSQVFGSAEGIITGQTQAPAPVNVPAIQRSTSAIETAITAQITLEASYKATKNNSLIELERARTALNSLSNIHFEYKNQQLAIINAQSVPIISDINSAASNITQLQILERDASRVSSEQELLLISQQFQTLQAQAHTTIDNFAAETENQEIKDLVTGILAEVARRSNSGFFEPRFNIRF